MFTLHQTPNYPRRVRNELRLRDLKVLRSERIGASFQRIVLAGEALTGFTSGGFADHCKLFFSTTGEPLAVPSVSGQGAAWPDGIKPPSRDYTPLYDPRAGTLTFDFYIHDGGIASQWAINARPGDILLVGGPRGSTVFPEEYGWQLYVTDESGLPALGRRLADLRDKGSTAQVTALVSIANEADKAYLAAFPGVNIEWFIRQPREVIELRLQQCRVPPQDYFIWITGEGQAAQRYGRHFDTPAIDPQLLHVSAYWHQKP